MGKREIKKQNKDLELHIVDIISKFDPSETGKYTNFLVGMLKHQLNKELESNRMPLNRLRMVNPNDEDLLEGFRTPKGFNSLENLIIAYLEDVFNHQNIETLYIFNEHLKNNRIPEGKRDISQYKNWEEIAKETSLATIKYRQKQLEKEVLTVFDTDGWLIIRPLTFESSLTYGSGTKWCTASRNNRDYFYRYSKNGVLCYVINKVDGDKYGLYYDMESDDFSIWNAPDRRIDSIETSIPQDLMKQIFRYMKDEKRNLDYFSNEEKERYIFMEKNYTNAIGEPLEQMPDEEVAYIEPHG